MKKIKYPSPLSLKDFVKNKYNMRPLTVTWVPRKYNKWDWKNFQAWINAGHDNYLMTPNTHVYSLVTRLSIGLLLHPFQQIEAL